MRLTRVFLLGLSLLSLAALGCNDATRRGLSAGEPQAVENHTAVDDAGPVKVFAAVDFGREDAFQPHIDLAIVNLGKQPIRLDGAPWLVWTTIYHKSGYADTEANPPRRWRAHADSGGCAYVIPPDLVHRVSGSDQLGPGECTTYRWSAHGLVHSGRTPNVLEVMAGVYWQDVEGTSHRTEARLYFAPSR